MFIGNQFDIFAAEGVTQPRGEIAERQSETAARLGIQVMDGTGEAIRQQPFRQRVGFEERAVNLLRGGGEDTMQTDGVLGMIRSPRVG